MCGIIGIYYKQGGPVVESLIKMLKSLQHRGSDSSGIAFYRKFPRLEPDEVLFVIDTIDTPGTMEKITSSVAKVGGDIRDIRQRLSRGYGLDDFVLSIGKEKIKQLREEIDKIGNAKILSFGKGITIIKEVGAVKRLEERYQETFMKRDIEIAATHGIGNVRFSTESKVYKYYAHPFQADFPDIAVVHNGQITNFNKMKERLEGKGHRFQTENDTEVIIHYVLDRMMGGFSFKESLEQSVEDLDGPFAYIISTADAIGMATDKLGLRPLVIAEENEIFATASEEVALMEVFDHPTIHYIPPGTVNVFGN